MKQNIACSFLPLLLISAATAQADEPTRLTGSFLYGVSNTIYPDGNYYPVGWGWDTTSIGHVDPMFMFNPSGALLSQPDSSVNIGLPTGEHTVNFNAGFRGAIFPTPPQVALSLYFNGSLEPQITIMSPFREQPSDDFGFNPYAGTAFRLEGGYVETAGHADWLAPNGDTVRVTSYWAAWPNVYPLDWVSENSALPDGFNDYRAQVSIEVIPIPAPSGAALAGLASLLCFGSRRR